MGIDEFRQRQAEHLSHGKHQQGKGKNKGRDKLFFHPGQFFPGFPLLFDQQVFILFCKRLGCKAQTGNSLHYPALADHARIKYSHTGFGCKVNLHGPHTIKAGYHLFYAGRT